MLDPSQPLTLLFAAISEPYTRGPAAALVTRRYPIGESLVAGAASAFAFGDQACHPAYAVRIFDAMRDEQPTAVRAHDGLRLLAPDHPRGA